jgi:dolichol kinase
MFKHIHPQYKICPFPVIKIVHLITRIISPFLDKLNKSSVKSSVAKYSFISYSHRVISLAISLFKQEIPHIAICGISFLNRLHSS